MQKEDTEGLTPEEIVNEWFAGGLPDDWSEFDSVDGMADWQIKKAYERGIDLDESLVRSFFEGRVSSYREMLESQIEDLDEEEDEEEIQRLQFEADGLNIVVGGGDQSGGGLIGSDAELERADKAWREARGDHSDASDNQGLGE